MNADVPVGHSIFIWNLIFLAFSNIVSIFWTSSTVLLKLKIAAFNSSSNGTLIASANIICQQFAGPSPNSLALLRLAPPPSHALPRLYVRCHFTCTQLVLYCYVLTFLQFAFFASSFAVVFSPYMLLLLYFFLLKKGFFYKLKALQNMCKNKKRRNSKKKK